VAALGQTHITVTSECAIAACEGWITVADTIRWDSGNTLSLHATGRIFINADIDATGAEGVAGGSVIVRSGFNADGVTSSGLTNGIYVDDALILTGGGESSGGSGLAGGNVILQARDGGVVFSGDGAIVTSGSDAVGDGSHAGGGAGTITILAGDDGNGVGIRLDDYALIAERGASVGGATDASRGALALAATTGTISQGSESGLLGASLVATTTTGNITLESGYNDVALLAAASDGGSIRYNNADNALTLGAIGSVLGVTTGGAGEVWVQGLAIAVTRAVSTGNGNLTLSANTGSQRSGDFIGIDLASGVAVTTGGGNLVLSGRGGDAATGNQSGVVVRQGAIVQAAGSGTVSVTGVGGESAGSNNTGVLLSGNGTSGFTRIYAEDGSVTVNGTGGGLEDTGAAGNVGVSLSNGAVISSGSASAPVSVSGQGGEGDGGGHVGVFLDGVTATADGTYISSRGGDVTVTAEGGDGGDNNDAIRLLNRASIGTAAPTTLSSGPDRNLRLNLDVGRGNSVAFGNDAAGFDLYAGTGNLRIDTNAFTQTESSATNAARAHVTGNLTLRRRSGGFDETFRLATFINRFAINPTVGTNAGVAGLNQISGLTITAGDADAAIDLAGFDITGPVAVSGDNVTVSQDIVTGGGTLSLAASDTLTLTGNVRLDTTGGAATEADSDGGAGGAVTLVGGDGGVVFDIAEIDTRGGAGLGTGAAGDAGSLTVTSTSGDIDQSSTSSRIWASSADFETTTGNIILKGGNALEGLRAVSSASDPAERGNIEFVSTSGESLAFTGTLQGNQVSVTHGADLTQTGGSIVANAFLLRVSNVTQDVTLTRSNDVGTFAATITGTGGLQFNGGASQSLIIDSVGDINGVTVQNGSLALTGLQSLSLVQTLSATHATNGAVSITAADNRAIDLGTDNADRLSLTEAEFRRINTPRLTLTTLGSAGVFNTAVVTTSGASAPGIIEINSAGVIEQSDTALFGFGHTNTGTMTLNANDRLRGLDSVSATQAMTLRGVGSLTLSGPRDLLVKVENTSGSTTTLSKLHITSTSEAQPDEYGVSGASNVTFTLTGSATAGSPALDDHYLLTDFTSTGTVDFRFEGNRRTDLGEVSTQGGSFTVFSPWGIKATEDITSTTGAIQLLANDGVERSTSGADNRQGKFSGVEIIDKAITTSGNIIIDGRAGGSGGHGVWIENTGKVKTTGSGTISITGIGRLNDGHGIFLDGADAAVISAGGSIVLDGSAVLASGQDARGILLDGGEVTNATGRVTLVGNRSQAGNLPRVAIEQSDGSVITANALELVTTRGLIDLDQLNNVTTLAANLSDNLFFDNGGNALTIGEVNGTVGIGITGGSFSGSNPTGSVFLSNIPTLTLNRSIINQNGLIYLRADQIAFGPDVDSVPVRVGNAPGTPVQNLGGKITLSGQSRRSTLSDRDIAFVTSTSGATELQIDAALLNRFHASTFNPRTAGKILIRSDIDPTTIRDALEIDAGKGIETTGRFFVALPNAFDQGVLVLRGGTEGGVGNTDDAKALVTRGVSQLFIESADFFNVEAEKLDGTAMPLKELGIFSISNGKDTKYRVISASGALTMTGTGTAYTIGFDNTDGALIDLSIATSADVTVNEAIMGVFPDPNASNGNDDDDSFDEPTGDFTIGYRNPLTAGLTEKNVGSVTIAETLTVGAFSSSSIGSFILNAGKSITTEDGSILIDSETDVTINSGAALTSDRCAGDARRIGYLVHECRDDYRQRR
jgi:hypothetical protein